MDPPLERSITEIFQSDRPDSQRPVQGLSDCRDQSGSVCWIDRRPEFASANRLEAPIERARHDGNAARHGFQKYDPESLAPAGEDKDTRGTIEVDQFLVRDISGEAYELMHSL